MADFVVWLGSTLVLFSIIFFMFGCIVGSFLNVVIHRLPREMSVANPPLIARNAATSFLGIKTSRWLPGSGNAAAVLVAMSPFPFVISSSSSLPASPSCAHGFWCIIISRLVQKIHFLSNPS